MGQQGGLADADCRRANFPVNMSSTFYRMIVSSIIQDKKLKIPGKFVKKLGYELPAVATLTTPNGCAWRVRLKKIEDKVWFSDGWHEFVEHQSIRVGFLLVFTFEGNSKFRVNIYDMANAEIKYQCDTLSSSVGPSGGNQYAVPYRDGGEYNYSVGFLKYHPSCQVSPFLENSMFGETVAHQKLGKSYDQPLLQKGIREADGIFSGTELRNSRFKVDGEKSHVGIVQSAARSTRDIGIQCNYGELVTSAYEIKLQSLHQRAESRKRKRGTGSSKLGSEIQIPGRETSSGNFLRKSRVVTPEEKERVLNAAKMFQSENPFCRVILRRSYIYKGIGLHMPSSFAEKYLGGVSGFITLQGSNGEKWPVRCMWRDGSAKLSKGWLEFVWDNKLEEGDVCVFERLRVEEVVLKVAIFRISEDGGPNQYPNRHLSRTIQFSSNHDLNG
ncbi:B3 domain-containing transcription factor VRN1-like isoform X2 [Diospyros lotus]|uniref:B3 domain-containing transcription factor VRN1-like isoform X2 n=1 Tax=Diospyros lotus TaxID=55363 RepID=UPI002251AAE5|nr:B3 domain-containing transcription factor VRN1-like isoform X2 [Diospyros lotus]